MVKRELQTAAHQECAGICFPYALLLYPIYRILLQTAQLYRELRFPPVRMVQKCEHHAVFSFSVLHGLNAIRSQMHQAVQASKLDPDSCIPPESTIGLTGLYCRWASTRQSTALRRSPHALRRLHTLPIPPADGAHATPGSGRKTPWCACTRCFCTPKDSAVLKPPRSFPGSYPI